MKVGEAKFGSKKKFFNFKDGDNVFRILPALGSLADKGIWSKYYKVCWGYKNSEGRTKLFQDCRVVNRETKMVEIESAAHQRVEQLKAKQAELKKNGADKATMDKMSAMLMRYNIEGKHHVNAVNLKGEIGLLKIGHKAKMALDSLIKKLREEEGVNALGVENGLYINFNRTGRNRDTLYQVSVYQQKVKANVNGKDQIIEQRVFHTMDDAFISRLDAEAFELADMYPAPTSEEIEQIVKGGPEVLDVVLAKYKKSSSSSSSSSSSASSSSSSSTAVQASPSASTISVDLSSDDDSLGDMGSVDTSDIEASSSGTVVGATASSDSSDMSDEDFLKSIGAL